MKTTLEQKLALRERIHAERQRKAFSRTFRNRRSPNCDLTVSFENRQRFIEVVKTILHEGKYFEESHVHEGMDYFFETTTEVIKWGGLALEIDTKGNVWLSICNKRKYRREQYYIGTYIAIPDSDRLYGFIQGAFEMKAPYPASAPCHIY